MRSFGAVLTCALLVVGCAAEPVAEPAVGPPPPIEQPAPAPAPPIVQPEPPPAPKSDSKTAVTYDPFQRWIELGGPELWTASGLSGQISAEDAQIRASLGCALTPAPNTVDGLLAEAYRAIDGFCN